jgi:hypothetical protein
VFVLVSPAEVLSGFFGSLDARLGSRSTMPLSASSLLVRFPFESENHAIAQQE